MCRVVWLAICFLLLRFPRSRSKRNVLYRIVGADSLDMLFFLFACVAYSIDFSIFLITSSAFTHAEIKLPSHFIIYKL